MAATTTIVGMFVPTSIVRRVQGDVVSFTFCLAASSIISPALLGSVVEVARVLILIRVFVLVMVGVQLLGRLAGLTRPDR